MASSSGSLTLVEWEVFVPAGPALAFHTGCIINNCFYIHGGISQYGSTSPSDKLYKLSLDDRLWNEVRVPGSPALSHHTCVVLENRFILLIGGWNGKKRSGEIFAFDTEKEFWIVPRCAGFPHDAGLSSHTATPLAKGEILILGREGSLRMQRRTGNAFLLQGNMKKGFSYVEFSRSVTSRSGHTSDVTGSNLVIIGGRGDKILEIQPGFTTYLNPSASCLDKIVPIVELLDPMSKHPCGRKHHITASAPCGIFLHGGDTFDGKSREPVGEMFFITFKPTIKFFKLGTSKVCRSGHVCCTNGSDVFIHGGVSGKNNFVCSEIFRLNIPDGHVAARKDSRSSSRQAR